jgi:short-subunit dehydrogenase
MHKGGPPGSEPCHLQAEDKARLAKRNITSSKLLSVNRATNRRRFRKIFMLNHLAGKAVVITGASSGIGQATAEAFARAGASIVLAARGTDALDAVAQKCRGLGSPNAIAVTTDVTDAEAVRGLVARARSLTGVVDIWVSNVGVGAVGRFHETPMAAHEQVIRANLIGHMNDAHAILPIFLQRGQGIFINVNSLGAFAATPFAAAYGASKYGLRGFSEALRAELAGQPRIHICDVYPSFIDTPGISHSANYVGRALTAPPPVYDARRVARTIVDLAKRPRGSTTVGEAATVIRFLHFLAPQLTTNVAAFLMQAYFRRARKVPTTDGNLFAPPARAGAIDGGLRARRRSLAAATMAVIVFAGFGAALLMSDRRPRIHHRS